MKRITEYSTLVVLSIIYVFLFWYFRYDSRFLMSLAAFGSVFYLTWGVLHQKSANRLNFTVILEYMLLALLAFLLVFTAITV